MSRVSRSPVMRELPAVVRAKALDLGAEDWLAELPALVANLAGRWELTLGAVFSDATEAYVVEARRADGSPAVLKLPVPRRGTAAAGHEIAVLRLAGGQGCAELYEYDEARGALLIERLGPAMVDLNVPLTERLTILSDLAASIWRVPTAGVALPTGADKGRWLADHIRRRWPELGEPCTRRTMEHAIAAAESRGRAHDPDRAVLVHGDIHQWNALRSIDGYKLVDPDGLWAEPEYDLGVLMREDAVELMAGDPWDRARWLAGRTGTDATAIWEWGVAERVSTGLIATAIGLQPVGAEMLAAADAISAAA